MENILLEAYNIRASAFLIMALYKFYYCIVIKPINYQSVVFQT